VLNLYRVPGTVPETVVLSNADRTLRDCGARDIEVSKFDVPLHYRLIATRSTGAMQIGTRAVRAEYNYFAVNATAGAALIEQIVLVAAEAYSDLASDIEVLTAGLLRSLLASIDSATRQPASPRTSCPAAAPLPKLPDVTATAQGEQ